MLEKIMNKKNLKSLSCVDNDNITECANVNIITRQGTNTNNAEISKNKVNNQAHPDIIRQKEVFKDASKIFEELSQNDIRIRNINKTLNELLQLLTKE